MGNAKIFLFDNDETLDSYRAGGVKKSHHHAAAMLWFFISSTVYILDSEILVLIFCVFWELSHLTRDLSQAEKEITVVTS